jgi:hypothetical protein
LSDEEELSFPGPPEPELFPEMAQTESPRLKWMRLRRVILIQPHTSQGIAIPWLAKSPDYLSWGFGSNEEDACQDFCDRNDCQHWSA